MLGHGMMVNASPSCFAAACLMLPSPLICCCLPHAPIPTRVLLLQNQAGATDVDITLPSGALWYEALAGQSVRVEKPGQVLTTAVNMEAIPVFYRGGAIVPRR